MEITLYGVRGSIPVPGPKTVEYGGNTTCIYVKLKSGKNIIIDAGTGIHQLGKKLMETEDPIHILLTHSHWDHVHGFPFFQPVYQSEREIYVYPSAPGIHGQLCSLLDQMDGAHFPVQAKYLPSKTECIFEQIEKKLDDSDLNVQRISINHPGGGHAYKLNEDGASFVFVTDNELQPPGEVKTSYKEWVDFCQGADLLIHDAQYLESELPQKHGWGHSVVSQARQLAIDADVKTVVLFHHDPERTDPQVKQIEKETQEYLLKKNKKIKGLCAREGMVFSI